MTEIHCPACSALLQISVADSPGSEPPVFPASADPLPAVSEKPVRKETTALAAYNEQLVSALREFVAVHPWSEPRLSPDIHADFIRWCRAAPDDAGLGIFLIPRPISKNKVSKLLVSELGAEYYKGPGGRLYSLPAALRPAPAEGGATAGGLSVEAPADVPLSVGGGLVPAGGVDLAGEGGLEVSGVASLPLAVHAAKVREQAAAEDAMPVPDMDAAVHNLVTGLGAVKAEPVDFVYVVKGGVRHKVPLKSPGDVAGPPMEDAVEPDYSLPENLVLDGPSVFPVEAGPAPAEPSGSWWVYLSDAEADLEPDALESIAVERLPERLVLAGGPLLRFDQEGAPYLQCPVHSVDGSPAGTGEVRVPLPWLKADEAEAAAAPLPSQEQLAAAAGHDALERARARASAAASPVFLATEDYEGADPGDWG